MGNRPSLETGRLLLRPFRLSDADDVQHLAGDRLIADTTLNIPHPYEDGVAEEWISKHQEIFDQGKGVAFAIETKRDDMLVGAISLMNVSVGHQAEMGYWVGRPFWNQGYCTEAALAVLRFAFQDMGLARVHASYLSRNPASGRVMQKIGMEYEGTRRQHARKEDAFDDLVLYGIVRGEWEKSAEAPPEMDG